MFSVFTDAQAEPAACVAPSWRDAALGKEPWEFQGEVGWGGIPCPRDPILNLNRGFSATAGCVWDSGRHRALLPLL